MAGELGLSQTAVSRIWRAFGLKPHLRETFELSSDPLLRGEGVRHRGPVHGPPEKAIVLCVDEKSQVQALDRTRPLLPAAEKASHDYVRHGTTSLFAGLDVATGKVVGECHRRHLHQEFVTFPDRIAATLVRESGTTAHVVMDNYGTHEHPRTRERFVQHPEFVPHFTPTSASWPNQVERFFAEITEKRIRRGSLRSVEELEAAIEDYWRAGLRTIGCQAGGYSVSGQPTGRYFPRASLCIAMSANRIPPFDLYLNETASA